MLFPLVADRCTRSVYFQKMHWWSKVINKFNSAVFRLNWIGVSLWIDVFLHVHHTTFPSLNCSWRQAIFKTFYLVHFFTVTFKTMYSLEWFIVSFIQTCYLTILLIAKAYKRYIKLYNPQGAWRSYITRCDQTQTMVHNAVDTTSLTFI